LCYGYCNVTVVLIFLIVACLNANTHFLLVSVMQCSVGFHKND